MPYVHGTIGPAGPIATVLIGVSEPRRRRLLSAGFQVPKRMTVQAIIDTGSIKGSVLHFEVRKGRQALDPQQWLRSP